MDIIRKRRMVMSILRRPRNPKIMMRCQNAMMMSQREMLTLNAVLVQLRQMVRGVCREPGIAQRG